MTTGRRTAAIMQPTWLPYLGYFQLIAAADVFVFLDDVQFARRSWQSRNRILRNGEEHLLTASVRKARSNPVISWSMASGMASGSRARSATAYRARRGKKTGVQRTPE